MVSHVLRATLLLASLLLSACSVLGLGGQAPTEVSAGGTAFDRAYDAGKRQMAANRLGLAIVDFQRALALDPRSVKTLNALGACYDDLHRYDIAMGFYKQALAIEPQSADTLNNMAVSLAMAGSPTDAEYTLRKAASLDPENQTIRLNMASMNSPGPTRSPPKHAEIAVLDERLDPNRPRIERTGVQTYMIYLSKRPSRGNPWRFSASNLTHKAAQRAAVGAPKKGHAGAGIHHSRLDHSRLGMKRTHAVMKPVGVATNIKLRWSKPDSVRNVRWR